LHLPTWANHQARRSTPFTPAVNALLGLSKALQELFIQGGWQSRGVRYRTLASRVAACLHNLGVRPWLSSAESSCVLRSYHLPEGLTYNALHDGLKQHGFIIYAGQGDLASEMFRVSTMGEISDYDVARLEQAFQIVVAQIDRHK
jgi:2-aminoethylphosphonate-pyruvate transaminase